MTDALERAEIEDLRRRVTEICLTYPDASVEEGGEHRIYRVRARTFAYFLHDHHGDGETAVSIKIEPGMNLSLIESDPARFYFPSYVGPRGWVSLRLIGRDVDWEEVEDLIEMSYRLVAPVTLVRQLDAT